MRQEVRRSFRRRGFTLVEVLVASALAAVGITAALGAMSAVAKSQARGRSTEEIARLAYDKYQTVFATYDLTQQTASGDFTDEGLDGYSWAVALQSSTVTNLDWMTLTVKDNKNSDRSYSVTGLVYVPPTTTTGAAGATGGTGGTGRAGTGANTGANTGTGNKGTGGKG